MELILRNTEGVKKIKIKIKAKTISYRIQGLQATWRGITIFVCFLKQKKIAQRSMNPVKHVCTCLEGLHRP